MGRKRNKAKIIRNTTQIKDEEMEGEIGKGPSIRRLESKSARGGHFGSGTRRQLKVSSLNTPRYICRCTVFLSEEEKEGPCQKPKAKLRMRRNLVYPQPISASPRDPQAKATPSNSPRPSPYFDRKSSQQFDPKLVDLMGYRVLPRNQQFQGGDFSFLWNFSSPSQDFWDFF